MQGGFGTDFIASRLSRAKIKCSICSSQFNTWDAQHRWALVLIVCLNRGRRFKARFVAPTGCPGIAVPPGSALTHHRWVSLTNSDVQESQPVKPLRRPSCEERQIFFIRFITLHFMLAACLLACLLFLSLSLFYPAAWTRVFLGRPSLSVCLELPSKQLERTTSLEQSQANDQRSDSQSNSYLPDEGLHRDHVGGGPRARPDHCTSAGLTPAIIPNVDNSVV